VTVPDTVDVVTPHGPARAHLHDPLGAPRATLVLGHGAGGGVDAVLGRRVGGRGGDAAGRGGHRFSSVHVVDRVVVSTGRMRTW